MSLMLIGQIYYGTGFIPFDISQIAHLTMTFKWYCMYFIKALNIAILGKNNQILCLIHHSFDS